MALCSDLTIVVALEQFSSAEANVSNEASTLITMYRQTVGMPVPEQTQMQRAGQAAAC